MPSFFERIGLTKRSSRIGYFNSDTIADELGVLLRPNRVEVNEGNALGISTVYACVGKISSTVASLGIQIYQNQNGSREVAENHPLHKVLQRMPNDYMTPFEFIETVTAYAVARGRGYAVIERDENGYATAFHPVSTENVNEVKTPYGRAFKVEKFGIIMPENMLEIYSMHRQSPIQLHRENLELTAAAKQFGKNYFEDGQLTGVMSSDQPLRAEQIREVIKSWREQGQAGLKLVGHGMKYGRISINPDEAQFIQTQKFQAEEICRIFNVPPALVWLESQTTYNNVEQQQISFARQTIALWASRWEQELMRKVIQERESSRFYVRVELDNLYRGDMAARVQYYQGMTQIGAMTVDEVCAKENLNPKDGGDVSFVQVNQIALKDFAAYSKRLANPPEPQPQVNPNPEPPSDDSAAENEPQN